MTSRPVLRPALAVLVLGLNLRTVVASLPPLLDDVRGDLRLTAAGAGLVTTGPVLTLAVLAPVGPRLARAVGIERVLLGCLLLTALAAAGRTLGGVGGLATGMLLGGGAVALAQSLVPQLVRLRHPSATGPLTAVYGTSLLLGATAAAAFATATRDAWGWRASLALWAVPAVAACAPWWRAARHPTPMPPGGTALLVRSPVAWAAGAYFGVQSALFFAQVTWLPSILVAGGASTAAAGRLQALGTLVAAPAALLLPLVAVHHRRPLPALLVVVVAWTAGLACLLVHTSAVVGMVLVGVGQGGALALALALPGLAARDDADVAGATALTLLVGYVLGACGGPLVGVVHDATGSWRTPLLVLLAAALLQVVPGVLATSSSRPGPSRSA